MIPLEELKIRDQERGYNKEEKESYIQHWRKSRLPKSKIKLTTFYSWSKPAPKLNPLKKKMRP